MASTISRHSLVYLPFKAVSALMTFSSIYIFTRILSTAQYGVYAVVLASINVLSIFTVSWLRQSILRYTTDAETQGELGELITTSLGAFSAISVFTIVAAVVTASLVNSYSSIVSIPLVLAGATAFSANGVFALLTSLLRARKSVVNYGFAIAFKSVAEVAIGASLIVFLPVDEIGAIIGIAVAGGTVSILMVYRLVSTRRVGVGRFSVEKVRDFWSYGSPFILTNIGGRTVDMADSFILLAILGSSAVGTYSAGYTLFYRLLFFLFSIVSLASYPEIVDDYGSSESDAAESLYESFCLFLLVAVPAAFGVYFLAPKLVELIIDPRYSESVVIAPWIAFGTVFFGLGQLAMYPIQLTEDTMSLIPITLVASVANVAVNVLLIPVLGIRAAAIATFLSFVLMFLMAYLYETDGFSWRFPFGPASKILLAAVGMYWVLVSLPPVGRPLLAVVVETVIGAAVYLTIITVIGRDILRRVLR